MRNFFAVGERFQLECLPCAKQAGRRLENKDLEALSGAVITVRGTKKQSGAAAHRAGKATVQAKVSQEEFEE